MKRMCEVEGCERPHEAKGMCKSHYKQSLYRANPAPVIARSKAYYWADLKRGRDTGRDRRMGKGASQHYDAQCEMQNQLCAICWKRPPNGLDHNHETGMWRGALCAACNSGFGDFGENIDVLKRAITYAQKWNRS